MVRALAWVVVIVFIFSLAVLAVRSVVWAVTVVIEGM